MTTLTREQFLRWAFLALIFSIPLGTKKFLFSFATPFSNFYTSEYTAAFLYGSDLLLLFALVVLAFTLRRVPARLDRLDTSDRSPRAGWFLAAFLLLTLFSMVFADYPAFGVYAFFRLFGAVVVGVFAWWMVRSGTATVRHIAGAFAASAVFQGVLAVLQFSKQGSVGLSWLGEAVALGPATPGVATIIVEGLPFLRAYGTLPHANLLAGFLVLGILALAYFFLTSERLLARALVAAGLVAVLAGLLLTFSRSGWIVAAGALVALFAFTLGNVAYWQRAMVFMVMTALSLSLLIGALQFAVFPRAHFAADEGPVRDRVVYNEMGLSLIAAAPWGVGLGNQLFYAYDRGIFHEFGLTARGQWQPIHNLYLLVAVETGLLGLAAFLALVLTALWGGGRRDHLARAIFSVALLSLLLFGLFDHFLWDLQAGRLMLWAVLGILLGLGARSSTDRMHPSEG